MTNQLTSQNWHHFDGRRNAIGLTDATGAVVQTYQYDVYSNLLPNYALQPGDYILDNNDYTQTDKQFDAYNQTSYFYARFYEAETGTWLTQDTYRGELNAPDTLHRYGYVTQSPVDYWDWYGWCPQTMPNGQTYDDGKPCLPSVVENYLDENYPGFSPIVEDVYQTTTYDWDWDLFEFNPNATKPLETIDVNPPTVAVNDFVYKPDNYSDYNSENIYTNIMGDPETDQQIHQILPSTNEFEYLPQPSTGGIFFGSPGIAQNCRPGIDVGCVGDSGFAEIYRNVDYFYQPSGASYYSTQNEVGSLEQTFAVGALEVGEHFTNSPNHGNQVNAYVAEVMLYLQELEAKGINVHQKDIVLSGHSGAGMTITAAVPVLELQYGYDISHVVLLDSPAAHTALASQHAYVFDIRTHDSFAMGSYDLWNSAQMGFPLRDFGNTAPIQDNVWIFDLISSGNNDAISAHSWLLHDPLGQYWVRDIVGCQ